MQKHDHTPLPQVLTHGANMDIGTYSGFPYILTYSALRLSPFQPTSKQQAAKQALPKCRKSLSGVERQHGGIKTIKQAMLANKVARKKGHDRREDNHTKTRTRGSVAKREQITNTA